MPKQSLGSVFSELYDIGNNAKKLIDDGNKMMALLVSTHYLLLNSSQAEVYRNMMGKRVRAAQIHAYMLKHTNVDPESTQSYSGVLHVNTDRMLRRYTPPVDLNTIREHALAHIEANGSWLGMYVKKAA